MLGPHRKASACSQKKRVDSPQMVDSPRMVDSPQRVHILLMRVGKQRKEGKVRRDHIHRWVYVGCNWLTDDSLAVLESCPVL